MLINSCKINAFINLVYIQVANIWSTYHTTFCIIPRYAKPGKTI